MGFDGIIAKSIVTELNNTILNGKINKIYEPNKNEIILGIYANGLNYALDIIISSNNYRLNLTVNKKSNPTSAPSFCMLLRKHLVGFKISKIDMCGLERIITLELEGYNELNDLIHKNVIIELMGKHSNIVLTNENNIIIDSLRHLDSSTGSVRDIMPAREYIIPVSNKIDLYSISNFEDFYSYTKSISSLDTGLPDVFTGISRTFIDYAISSLGIDSSVSIDNLKLMYSYINSVLTNIPKSKNSCCLTSTGDFTVIPKNRETDTSLYFNLFIDDFYFAKETSEDFIEYRNSILRLAASVLGKISKKLKNINLKLEDCKNIDTYRLYGELLTANLYKIKNLKNENFIELENYYDNNKKIKIPLDNKYSISINSKNYFKKYNKLKNTLSIVSKQKLETEKEINYIESIIYELDRAKTITDVNEIYTEMYENKLFENLGRYKNKSISTVSNKKYAVSNEPIKMEIDGYIVLIGKNNKQNDYLTTKIAKKDDFWFHTKDVHGSHVILCANHSTPDIDVIIRCAQLAAYYSKACLSSNVNVDYTLIKNVKKPTGAKPGMVIYTNNETLTVKPKN